VSGAGLCSRIASERDRRTRIAALTARSDFRSWQAFRWVCGQAALHLVRRDEFYSAWAAALHFARIVRRKAVIAETEPHVMVRPIVRFSDRRLRAAAEPISVFDVHVRRPRRQRARGTGQRHHRPHLGILKHVAMIKVPPHWTRGQRAQSIARRQLLPPKHPSVSIKAQRQPTCLLSPLDS
jgi:hypothetical protein